MPNIQSAIQRAKRTKIQTSINKIRRGKYKSAIKKMYSYIDSKKIKDIESYMPKFHSQLMKVAKTGVISRKTAARKISRISQKIKYLKKTKKTI